MPIKSDVNTILVYKVILRGGGNKNPLTFKFNRSGDLYLCSWRTRSAYQILFWSLICSGWRITAAQCGSYSPSFCSVNWKGGRGQGFSFGVKCGANFTVSNLLVPPNQQKKLCHHQPASHFRKHDYWGTITHTHTHIPTKKCEKKERNNCSHFISR